jgi:hypothetical protein
MCPYLFVQNPPPNCGLTKQPPQPDGHPEAGPQYVVVQEARSQSHEWHSGASLIVCTGLVVLYSVVLSTLTLDAAFLLGRAMGPATTTAANRVVMRVVSYMVICTGLWVA